MFNLKVKILQLIVLWQIKYGLIKYFTKFVLFNSFSKLSSKVQ